VRFDQKVSVVTERVDRFKRQIDFRLSGFLILTRRP
jgi:hypothetical protein